MIVKFQIEYFTNYGQQLFIGGSIPRLGKWEEQMATPMTFQGDGKWEFELQIKSSSKIEYKYFIRDENGSIQWEFGDNRFIEIKENTLITDHWRSVHDEQNVLYTSPFRNAFLTEPKDPGVGINRGNVRFSIRTPNVAQDQGICISGGCEELGNWDAQKVVPLNSSNYPLWENEIKLKSKGESFEYKYGTYDKQSNKLIAFEGGPNRSFRINGKFENYAFNDEHFNHPQGNWKGAGVAIPVFSLRSKKGLGVGEFTDLIPLVDWAKRTGLKLVQVLPVNDTVATHTWVDSYPYAGISVFALHPIYASLDAIGPLKDKDENKKIEAKRKELNALETVDYETVMKVKSRYFKLKFDEVRNAFLKSKDFKSFFEHNQHWLVSYAAFSYLRDLNCTPDFTKWKKYKTISEKELEALTSPDSKVYEHIAVHYFIQYHLDKQLKEATTYARANHVVLKGDIPIGIYRHSVDAWIAPHLFNMDGQSGAPPDAFSGSGQNWGFPTYNWAEMAKDGYMWWKERLTKMTDFFDVFRIDHILGFFRIWEIPWDAVEGTLGRFNPSLPITKDELASWGINFDYDRLCKPYIRDFIIAEVFGEHGDEVRKTYLEQTTAGNYVFKPEFDTQRKIKEYFDRLTHNSGGKEHRQFIKNGLLRLAREIIFLDAPLTDGKSFNPNIDLYSTFSYRDLDDYQQKQLIELHRQYFFYRHNDFWKEQAMEKLPALMDATDMLVCGEDLGMVPDSVPGVMRDLQMLSLAIHRMPSDNTKEFWHPADMPYLSVCTSGSHDTSTLRQWWEEDHGKIQRYFNNILGNHGDAPFYCEPWVADQVVAQHLHSPSMWTILPIQDLLAMDGELRRVFPQDEHINRPEIIPHYWHYRFHLNIEDLLDEEDFNDHLLEMVKESGRA